jgi:hypothetical protein
MSDIALHVPDVVLVDSIRDTGLSTRLHDLKSLAGFLRY